MRKIHVTRQCFEASGPQGHFFEKKQRKNPFLDMVREVWPGSSAQPTSHKPTDIFTREIRNILDRLLVSRGF